VFAPRLIVISRPVSKCRKNAIEVVLIFQANVLVDNCHASRAFVI
jgi:hypothetical protein